MWNILGTVSKGDYIYAIIPNHPRATNNRYVLEHRAVMENEIGRLLEPWELVHHKDENKRNNDPRNLQIVTSAEHRKLHSTGRTMIDLICPNCGKSFQREKRNVGKGETRSFCSRHCSGAYYRT